MFISSQYQIFRQLEEIDNFNSSLVMYYVIHYATREILLASYFNLFYVICVNILQSVKIKNILKYIYICILKYHIFDLFLDKVSSGYY